MGILSDQISPPCHFHGRHAMVVLQIVHMRTFPSPSIAVTFPMAGCFLATMQPPLHDWDLYKKYKCCIFKNIMRALVFHQNLYLKMIGLLVSLRNNHQKQETIITNRPLLETKSHVLCDFGLATLSYKYKIQNDTHTILYFHTHHFAISAYK